MNKITKMFGNNRRIIFGFMMLGMGISAYAGSPTASGITIQSISIAKTTSSDLTGLSLSGSPSGFSFLPTTYTYPSIAVDNSVSSVTATPSGSGTITVNGATVASGQASSPVSLTEGSPATVTVINKDAGKEPKTYSLTVTRRLNSNKAFTAFTLPNQLVSTSINETDHTIAVTLPYGSSVSNLVATFTINGATTKVGSTSQVSGTSANDFTYPVTYTVTAADGTTQNYTVTVTVQGLTANLTGLALSPSPSGFTFSAGTHSYSGLTVANNVSSISVTPTGTGTITVNGATIASGNSATVNLTAGSATTISVVATETGKASLTYTILVTRYNSFDVTATGR